MLAGMIYIMILLGYTIGILLIMGIIQLISYQVLGINLYKIISKKLYKINL